MNYFAQIVNGVATDVIVISDADCNDLSFPESEPVGQAFIASLGIEGAWLQTSITGEYRGCYAGVGYTYDAALDIFVAPPRLEA
jgi:hypothetical protein